MWPITTLLVARLSLISGFPLALIGNPLASFGALSAMGIAAVAYSIAGVIGVKIRLVEKLASGIMFALVAFVLLTASVSRA